MTIKGAAFGSPQDGYWAVYDVDPADEERENAQTREWFRKYDPEGYQELFGAGD